MHPPLPNTTESYIAEIYNAIASIRDDISDINRRFDSVDKRCAAEDTRVKMVETWQTRSVGIAVGAGVFLGWLVPEIGRWLISGRP